MPGPKVDKHSTGGVGDKTSLILAPLAAACGVPVPMMSGRGLGHTGGTLDKLESIPGFRVGLSLDEFRDVLRKCAPGPDRPDAARSRRPTRSSTRCATSPARSRAFPLIAASIMSKKIAEGIDALVLDVKTGGGAFMQESRTRARWPSRWSPSGAAWASRPTALITDMDQPLGRAVGNALEVVECIETLQGPRARGSRDALGRAGGADAVPGRSRADALDAARARVRDALASGAGPRAVPRDHRAAGRRSRASATTLAALPRARETSTSKCARPSGRVTAHRLPSRRPRGRAAGRRARDAWTSRIDPAVGVGAAQEGRATPSARASRCSTVHVNDRAPAGRRRSRMLQSGGRRSAPRRRPPRAARARGARLTGAAARRCWPSMERLLPLVGLGPDPGRSRYAFSTNRRAIRLKTVAWGLGLQFALALFVLKTPLGQQRLRAGWATRSARLLRLRVRGLASSSFGPPGRARAGGTRAASSSRSRCCRRSSSSPRCSRSSTTSA